MRIKRSNIVFLDSKGQSISKFSRLWNISEGGRY